MLQTFSRPARALWQVTALDDVQIDAVDMNNNDLVLLVRACLQNDGQLSTNRYKQLVAKGHPAALLEQAQRAVTLTLQELGDDN